MFSQGLKLRSRQLLQAVSLVSNLTLSTPPDNSCQQPIWAYYLLLILVMLSTNSCATVTVSMWVILLQGCNKGSNSMFPNPSCKYSFHTTTDILPIPANPIGAHLKPRAQQLDNIFCKTHYVCGNTMKENSQCSPKDAWPFIFPFLKLLT